MDYSTLKSLHMLLAGLSFSGFLARAGGVLAGAGWARARLARILPHLLDTALLVSALVLLARLQWVPLQQGWLIAKLCALLGYIGCGFITLRFAHNNRERLLATAAGCLCFAYMLAAALTKSAWPFG